MCASGESPSLMIEHVCWQVLNHRKEMNMCGDRRVFTKNDEYVCWRVPRQGRRFRAGHNLDERVFIPTAHT